MNAIENAKAMADELARAYGDWKRRNLVAPAVPDAVARAVFAAGWNYGHYARRIPPPTSDAPLPDVQLPSAEGT